MQIMYRTRILSFVAISSICACTRREQDTPHPQQEQVSTMPTPLSTSILAPAAPATNVGTEAGAGAGGGSAKVEREAEAEFKAAKGYKLKGNAKFEEISNMVRVVVEVSDAPKGKRGIHVHERPDCSDIPGKSMGEHFNPTANAHALPPTASRHLGDLGNIEIGQDGKGKLEILLSSANLKDNDPSSLLNRAIVIHEDEDKGLQPSGDAGKPMACAVIKND